MLENSEELRKEDFETRMRKLVRGAAEGLIPVSSAAGAAVESAASSVYAPTILLRQCLQLNRLLLALYVELYVAFELISA